MSFIPITIFVQQPKHRELQERLKERGSTVHSLMENAFQDAYNQLVPPQRRHEIETDIKRQVIADKVLRGEIPQYSIVQITENGEPRWYMSNQYEQPYDLALELAMREGVAPPPVEGYRPLGELVEISKEQYKQALAEETSPAVMTINEIDLDLRTMGYTHHSAQETWYRYSLDNALDAALETSQTEGLRKPAVFRRLMWEKGIEVEKIEPEPTSPALEL